MDKQESSFSCLARGIMDNYTCLACLMPYRLLELTPEAQVTAQCPHCGRTYKQQVESMAQGR